MADLSSTRVFGKLTVMHEAIVKANAEITGNITAAKFIGDGSGLTGTASLRATGTTKADVGLGNVANSAQVTISGNQSISGVKTFTGSVHLNGSNSTPDLVVSRTNAVYNALMRFSTTSETDVFLGQGDSGHFAVGRNTDMRYSNANCVFDVDVANGNVRWKGTASGDGSGLTGTASLRATGTTKGDVGLGNVANVDQRNASNLTSGTVANARLPTTATRWPAWSEVTGKPSSFAPTSHTHTLSQITDAGTMASRAAGTGGSSFRTNTQNDSRFVQLTGNQEVSGVKTFTSNVVARSGGYTRFTLESTGRTGTSNIGGITAVDGNGTTASELNFQANGQILPGQGGFFGGNGSGLTNLNASNISSGTLPAARLPSGYNPFNPSGTYSGLRAQATTKGDVGLSGIPNTNGSTSNFLRGDGTWVNPPNTTYSEISTAEIDAGTASTRRTISGRRMKYALDKKSNTGHTHSTADISGLSNAATTTVASIRSGTTKANVGLSNVKNVDQTNASNLSSGTVPDARLPSRFIVGSAAATDTLNLAQQQVFHINVSSNRTISLSNAPGSSRAMTVVIHLYNASLSSRAITWPSGIIWQGGQAPEFNGTEAAVILVWTGRNWLGSVGVDNA